MYVRAGLPGRPITIPGADPGLFKGGGGGAQAISMRETMRARSR